MLSHPLKCGRLHTPLERKDGGGLDRLECGLIELKFDTGTEQDMIFEGYGAVFGNVDSGGDLIEKGAFKKWIREAKSTGDWPAMLSQHGGLGLSADDLTPIGIWIEMEEDDKGLRLKGKLAPTPRGIEMNTLMRMKPRPAINGLSIGYRAIKFKMGVAVGEPRRTLQELYVRETSPVTFPMNTGARVQSIKNVTGIRLAEKALRDAGFSATEAKAIVSKGFTSQPRQRDVGGLGDIAAALRQSIETLV